MIHLAQHAYAWLAGIALLHPARWKATDAALAAIGTTTLYAAIRATRADKENPK